MVSACLARTFSPSRICTAAGSALKRAWPYVNSAAKICCWSTVFFFASWKFDAAMPWNWSRTTLLLGVTAALSAYRAISQAELERSAQACFAKVWEFRNELIQSGPAVQENQIGYRLRFLDLEREYSSLPKSKQSKDLNITLQQMNDLLSYSWSMESYNLLCQGQLEQMKQAVHCNDLERLRLITGTINHPAFQSCEDVPSFFAILQPSYSAELPENWEELVGQVPKSEGLEAYEKAADTLLQDKSTFTPWDEIHSRMNSSKDKSANNLLVILTNTNPLFRKAWELAGNPKVIEHDFERTFYLPSAHCIYINKNESVNDKTDSIIFETFNALQKSSFEAIEPLIENQNDEALFNEWVEYFSSKGFRKIIRSMSIPGHADRTFPEYWDHANTPQKNGEIFKQISHADRCYRIAWIIRYYYRNPGFLQKRLRDLGA